MPMATTQDPKTAHRATLPSTLMTSLRSAPLPEPGAETERCALNPTQLDKPAFVLAVPFSFATEVANNPWMQELSAVERAPNRKKAMRQWLDFYHYLAAEAVVYLLPSRGDWPLQDNVYAGGYGIRSEREAYEWMENHLDIRVVKLRETEPYLYHLDCTVFPLTRESTLVCTELYTEQEVRELERYTNIIDAPLDDCFSGVCNSVRLSNTLLNASHITELRAGTEEYAYELAKNRRLEDIAASLGFELTFFNLSEYLKGGALLSCAVMHLNRYSYEFA